jgi:hypothetical protein
LAKWTSKELFLTTKSSKEGILFLEALQKLVKTVDIIADYFPGKLNIRFEGNKDQLQDAIETANDIHRIVNGMLYPDIEGFYDFDIAHLNKIGRKSLPIQTLTQILQYKGYETFREENIIVTKATYQEMTAIMTALNNVLDNMPYEVATTSLKQVLATIAIVKELPVKKIIKEGKKAEIIQEDDLKRLSLAIEAKQAVEKYLKLF